MATRIIFPEGYHYDCGSCSKCCHTEWNVFVDPTAFEKVCGSPLFDALKEQHGTDPMYMGEVEGNRSCLALVKKDGCVFLDSDNLCMIHRDMGLGSKPLGCREFPFLPVPTPDGVVIGLSFYCTAVQDDKGRETREHADKVVGMLREYRYTGVGFKPIPLTEQVSVTWDGYKLIEEMAREELASSANLRSAAWRTFKKVCLVAILAERAVQSESGDEAAPAQAGPKVIDDERLADILEMANVDHIPEDEIFRAVENMFLVGVLGVLESTDKPQRRIINDAIVARETFTSGIFKKDIDLRSFDDFRLNADTADSEAPFKRYLGMLLFRKFLALKRTILANAALYYLTLGLLEWYRDLSAYATLETCNQCDRSGAPGEVVSAGATLKTGPDMDDVRLAFDVLERDLVGHTRGLDAFFHEMGRTYVRQIELVPGVFTGAPASPPTLGLFAD